MGTGRCSAEIEEAENGYIVRVSSDNSKGEYQSKRFVASDQREAQGIAARALSGKIKVGKKKGRRGHGVEPQTSAPKAPRKRARRKKA